ncbi:hypothetical protein CAPTEDRAFT_228287 [Capitella teleta]|uniref:dihydrofolate reductase n=1 Tax=Capitella teleta TaxID=283909 RepID=R7UK12_CAPTE|nr:hypothetical protein CAPTEDRAFT_228287 [Capitella teleta]|eukprot:ELU06433.1 hypothetical protein CAPTEDRAFT_228287 [Capitella teleta]
MSSTRLNLVVAACTNKGIGVDGRLPWTIRGDMAFFRKITSETSDPGKQNVVLMGRKTWESIPAKHRPLPNRINVVLSASLKEAPQGSLLIRNFEDIFPLMESSDLKDKINELFVIGGSSLYTMSFKSSHPVRVFLTTVLQEFHCDTFLPEMDDILNKYQKIEFAHEDIGKRTENGIPYQIEVYDKLNMSKPLVPIKICAAMLENRGIGFKGKIPWPHIKKDYDHYSQLTQGSIKSGKKVVNIKGRATWQDTGDAEKARPNVITIIISKTLSQLPEGADYLVEDFNEAHCTASSLFNAGVVSDVWVMGGQAVYKSAIESPHCSEIHLTEIKCDLEADRFFPEFESLYSAQSGNDFYNTTVEDGGIQYQFKLYHRLPKYSA